MEPWRSRFVMLFGVQKLRVETPRRSQSRSRRPEA
jgi:hypothetical protein